MVREFTDAANNPSPQAAETAEQDKAARNFSMADAIVQNVYGPGPTAGPEHLREAARMLGAFENRIDGTSEWTIGNGGRLGESLRERLREKEKEDQEYFQGQMSQIAEAQQREREEWSQRSHSFAGVTMTGAQWGQMGEELSREGPLRDFLVERLMRDGRSREDAERRAAEMAEIYKLMNKPWNQLTEEERRRVTQAQSNPDFQQHTADVARRFSGRNGPATALDRQVTNSGQQIAVPTRADLLGSGVVSGNAEHRSSDFPSAPRATEHHRAAVAAREPLDAPSPPATRVAAAPAVPSAGFDSV